LIKEDFPTLERPTNANSGHAESGYCLQDTAPVRNSAEIIFITKTSFFRPLNEPALRVKFIYRQVCMYNSLVKLQIGTSFSSISIGTIKRGFWGKLV
jgi:hypothetical protein